MLVRGGAGPEQAAAAHEVAQRDHVAVALENGGGDEAVVDLSPAAGEEIEQLVTVRDEELAEDAIGALAAGERDNPVGWRIEDLALFDEVEQEGEGEPC